MTTGKQKIIDLETRFWTSIKDRDIATGQSMVADDCLVAGPEGTMRIDPEKFGQQSREAQWRLDDFEFRDADVIQPSEDVAVITYKVRQTGEFKGKPMDLTCADSSVWVRDGESWKCALHTETILEDATAKARQPEPA